jgi:hypothetical protein
MENFLKNYPEKQVLLDKLRNNGNGNVYDVNNHLHTPFSFSAFKNIGQIFELAKKEGINILGINDFYVMDGYEDFYDLSMQNNVFPLFNVEFIGLLEKEQQQNIRVNDPNNPGRTYFCGKGLDFPVSLSGKHKEMLAGVRDESQRQVKEMINKANDFLSNISDISLSYEEIKNDYAKELVRERHIATAIREKIFKHFTSEEDRKAFLTKLYSGKESQVDINNTASLENEIRGNLLKSGGVAFVPEDPKAFLSIEQVIQIILNAGGIPCYPTLLDDKNGHYTEYEEDPEKLYQELTAKNIYSLELIPIRNYFDNLKKFVRFFREKGFVISFGTEHNTPDLIPLKVATRDLPLDDELREISFEGSCVIAAHQYLRAKGEKGYVDEQGKADTANLKEYIDLGKAIYNEYFKK